ncbi:MAG: hypothetical protein KGL02_13510 [Acidobacteriota bacterium]|nr:hypothetical protein [Acidobacteriota bacterium]
MANWLTRPLFNVPPKFTRILWAVLCLAALLLFTSPMVLTLGWHAIHGNSVEFRGHTIAVPLRWTADPEGLLNLSMYRHPATLVQGVRFTSMISIAPTLPRRKGNTRPDYAMWEKAYWNTALPGQTVNGPIRTGSGSHEAVCMEAIDAKGAGLESASCLMLGGSWEADFLGRADDMDAFFGLIRNFR